MRELKFRVWSDFCEKYADFDAELYMDGSVEADFTDGTGIPHHETTDLVVEQYTGIKDKNGKEICEGDIVRYVSEGEDVYLAVIKRKDEDKEQSYWLTGFVYEPFATVDEEELTEDEYESLCGMEIIGNIHENPELLKKEK